MRRWAERAIEISREQDHRPLELVAGGLLAYAAIAAADRDGEALVTAAAALLDDTDDRDLAQRIDAAIHVSWAESLAERFRDSQRHAERGLAVSRATGQGQFLAPLLLGHMLAALWQGHVAEAVDVAQTAVEGARLGAPGHILAHTLLCQAWVNIYAGKLDLAIAAGEEASRVWEGAEQTVISGATAMFLGIALLEVGDLRRGREELLHTVGGPAMPRHGGTLAYEALTRAELALGHVEAADRWAGRAEAVIPDNALPLETSFARRARAGVLLARGEAAAAADAALSAAVLAEEVGVRVEAARARTLAGQALAKAGQRADALSQLEDARRVLVACGAPDLAAQASAILRRLGRRNAPGTAKGAGPALTEREGEIAELVARGLSNREIAAACFLSPKTVERHLSNIFVKLGVSTRAGVAGLIGARASQP
jgi:ATP/maltotriose-dependent transcriptional regulator MalT